MKLSEIRHLEIGIENRPIRHEFTQDELDIHRQQYVENEFLLSDAEEALAKIASEHKVEIKELKIRSKKMRDAIRARGVERMAEVSVVPNYETFEIEYYEGEELVDSRRMLPKERQMNILQAKAI